MKGDSHFKLFKLPNGSRLAASFYGDKALSVPVFYFHGVPGSRLEAGIAHEAALKRGLTIIALDRPGIGRSDYEPERTLLDWPEAVASVADQLSLDKFSILGISGGGPYAAVCAAKLAQRVKITAMVSGISPLDNFRVMRGMTWPNRFLLLACRYFPGLSRPLFRGLASWWLKSPHYMLKWYKMILNETDVELLSDDKIAKSLMTNYKEALLNGVDGVLLDLRTIVSPWGFDLSEITGPVFLWHGEEDYYLPLGMGQYQSAKIKHSTPIYVPKGGHFMAISRMDEILDVFKN